MSDFSRDRLDGADDDRLPWLEPVEEEIDEEGSGTGRIVAMIVGGLLIIVMLVGGYLWLHGRSQMAASGDGSVIKAPDAYYKERPASPGGMDVGSGDEIVYSASKGNEVQSVIDVNGAAETPVNVDRKAPAPVPAASAPPAAILPPHAAPAAAPATDVAVSTKVAPPVAKPAPPKPKPVTVAPEPVAVPPSGGSTVQLGAFSTEAKANAAWKTLSARFSFLQGLSQSVAPVKSGDKTLYRLRAGGGSARDVCAKLRTAGESCTVIG
ncbi:Sporulation related domain-containing protein [Sphingomonas sp. YR710]|uniref:SPOR domain-containing protein n=1 Tax=Sphingomonas sp. YR710 TaxID=1882773 RepID=UPI0008817AC0|nr:SPOR domain-containing protein [Sphingomonas sp. YR710]SDC72515.1 Sporulation related domain-containing protein [Sphingomonas sp. YR710]